MCRYNILNIIRAVFSTHVLCYHSWFNRLAAVKFRVPSLKQEEKVSEKIQGRIESVATGIVVKYSG